MKGSEVFISFTSCSFPFRAPPLKVDPVAVEKSSMDARVVAEPLDTVNAPKASCKQTSVAASRGANARAGRARRRGPTATTSMAEAVDGSQGQAGVGVPYALSVKQEQVGLGAGCPVPGEPVVGPCSERAAPRGGAGAQRLGRLYARHRPRAARHNLCKGGSTCGRSR